MRKRIGYLIVLPGISCAVTCLEVLRRHGLSTLNNPAWWLLAAGLIILLVSLNWYAYSRFQSQSAGISLEKSSLIDLASHAPLLVLPLYLIPGHHFANTATHIFIAALGAFIALRLAVLALYHPQWWEYLKDHPGGVLLLITIVGALIRISLLDRNRLHVDEALYSSWALSIASGKDIFLRFTLVDKPPVPIYVVALFFKVLGASEVVARLPNLLASAAGIIVLYHIGKKLYGESAGLLAAGLLAASPYDIQFAPTVFNDPLMVTLTFGAVLLAMNQRSLAAGLCFGLACMSKLLALALIPLVLVAFYASLRGEKPLSSLWRMLLVAGAGTLAVFAVVGIWDIVIRANMPRFLNVQTVNYNGLNIVSVGEFWQRLTIWIGYLQDITGSIWLNILLICGLAFIVLQAIYYRLRRPETLVNLGLCSAGVLYLAPFALFSFRLYDRYLLPLAPLSILILAWFLDKIYRVAGHWLGRLLKSHKHENDASIPQISAPRLTAPASILALVFVAVLGFMLVRPVRAALDYAYPLGGDHGTFQGIDTVAAYYRGNAPFGSIIYHKELGWHYSFYLFDAPFHFVYYQDDTALPQVIAEARLRYPGVEQYLTLEQWLNHDELRATLARAGWRLVEQYRTFRPNGTLSFIVYRIEVE
ncbi:MAG: ArnT family glycosyltransferase [Anaerolineae bacterium]